MALLKVDNVSKRIYESGIKFETSLDSFLLKSKLRKIEDNDYNEIIKILSVTACKDEWLEDVDLKKEYINYQDTPLVILSGDSTVSGIVPGLIKLQEFIIEYGKLIEEQRVLSLELMEEIRELVNSTEQAFNWSDVIANSKVLEKIESSLDLFKTKNNGFKINDLCNIVIEYSSLSECHFELDVKLNYEPEDFKLKVTKESLKYLAQNLLDKKNDYNLTSSFTYYGLIKPAGFPFPNSDSLLEFTDDQETIVEFDKVTFFKYMNGTKPLIKTGFTDYQHSLLGIFKLTLP